MASLALAVLHAQLPWLVCGALGGYVLVMLTNPVRPSLRDGWRCIRRYATLWVTLGVFGFAGALFDLARRLYFAFGDVLPFENRPVFVFLREAWRDPRLWLVGSTESIWYLPKGALLTSIYDSRLPALESTAGLFNCAVSTFPISVLAALLLFFNWQNHRNVILRALVKRFGRWGGGIIFVGVILGGLAALAKPFVYVMLTPQVIEHFGSSAHTQLLWAQWSQVAVWVGFLFEYFFGVCMQIYLILLAYVWVRGLTFTHAHLLDFAIRRCSFVLKWALLVMLFSSVFIDLPLILKNFDQFQRWFPDSVEVFDKRVIFARALLAAILLLFATVQITLVFHSESLLKALRDHWTFIARHFWPLGWFGIVAGMHFYLFQVVDGLVLRGLGQDIVLGDDVGHVVYTAPSVLWSLLTPWLRAVLTTWLLASWVCLFKRCDTGRSEAEHLIEF